tara:strand:- start:43 stop:603 length:561 start_codon:yes stop_codon:yes gene_type:complete
MSTLKVDTILKRTGTGTITVGQSGDTISIPSGATLNSAGTNTLEGIDNTPAFQVQKSAAQSISNNTTTKVTFDTEILDTDNTFASDKFTPGVAGKYQLSCQVGISNMDDQKYNQVLLYKNGSQLNSKPMTIITGSNTQDLYSRFVYIVDANTTDYFEIYVRHNNGNSRDLTFNQQTNFAGFRILGA